MKRIPVWLLSGLMVSATVGPVRGVTPRRAAEAADTARAVHLLNRATFGLRDADLARVLAEGEAAWLDAQLHPERLDDGALGPRLARFPAASASVTSLYREYPQARPRPASTRGMPGDSAPAMTAAARRMRAETAPARILGDLVGAKLTRAVHSERQLEEVMTDFWFNHFNVFWGKGADRYLTGDFERRAIRPYVFGRFEDMLRATARHPAMLFYLDNWTSAAPDPAADRQAAARQRGLADRLNRMTRAQKERLARQRGVTVAQLERLAETAANATRRTRGINENYARELMELHTLGVDGGYTQDDVVSVARALTGWTMTPPGPNAGRGGAAVEVRFVFRPELHDQSEKTVLGRTLPAGRGIEDGEDVIRLLAHHPATARHIATELVERFVSDTPDPGLVDELVSVFERTDGDLREVTRALFTSDRFYAEENRGMKVKSPFRLVASALRSTGAEVAPSRRLVETLRGLGEVPYLESAPTGYPSSSEDWVNSGSMLGRMNFAIALASGRMDGIRFDGARFAGGATAGRAGEAWLDAMLASLLPGVPHEALAAGIRADLEEQARAGATRRALATRAVGLALGAPEFQRH